MSVYDAWIVKGTDRKGRFYESDPVETPGKARAIARRKGGEYELKSRIAPGHGNAGMWSGGECGKFD